LVERERAVDELARGRGRRVASPAVEITLVVLGSATVRVASPAVEITLAVVEAK